MHEVRTIVIDDPGVCQSVCVSRGRAVKKLLNGRRRVWSGDSRVKIDRISVCF